MLGLLTFNSVIFEGMGVVILGPQPLLGIQDRENMKFSRRVYFCLALKGLNMYKLYLLTFRFNFLHLIIIMCTTCTQNKRDIVTDTIKL